MLIPSSLHYMLHQANNGGKGPLSAPPSAVLWLLTAQWELLKAELNCISGKTATCSTKLSGRYFKVSTVTLRCVFNFMVH